MGFDDADRRKGALIWGALITVYIVWGSTYLGIRIMIESMPPLISGAMRFLAAGLVLGLVLLLRRGPAAFRVTGKQVASAALVGVLLLTGGNGMVAVAEQHISSGLAALLVASVPLWLVIFRIAARDRPRLLTLTGVLVGFAGVAALSLTGGTGDSSTTGIVTILLASVSWSLGSWLSGKLPMPENPFTASTIEMLVGGVTMTAIGLAAGERLIVEDVTTRSWLALAYMILVGSLIGFTSYIWLLGNAPISLVSTYAYVNPVVAVILGALIVNEQVTAQMAAAGLIIVIGVALVVSTEGRRRPAPDRQEPALARTGDT
ncbi:drug/metabolite transporter (DMT)-like permease [Thermocatellispora tengchongensis]|uniref:Drug/metabolite transporter (DMT)-like permease n=1 Tax=Thermocatellispora tengchongensis TaxID=1073253 RepID=A0A840NYZ5_9ACTN|nr:EamA family transporter [Thermocatellispora tengchongensis]MBB5130923.1 drug/metabolite transporter (DMT)-like permease [Thermocatellispora tengchongensis]